MNWGLHKVYRDSADEMFHRGRAHHENELELVAEGLRAHPGRLGGRHLDDDAADAPDITLAAIAGCL